MGGDFVTAFEERRRKFSIFSQFFVFKLTVGDLKTFSVTAIEIKVIKEKTFSILVN